MIFVFDVGNTNMIFGVYEGEELLHHWRMSTDGLKTEDEYAMTIQALFADVGLSFTDISGIAISSVVPSIMFALERMCEKYFHRQPLVIGPEVATGLVIAADDPKEVGADRIVNAVAGIHLFGPPLIIVDFGTATTYCYVDEEAKYRGGAIAPGIETATDALISRASKLPRIEITQPPSVIGANTIRAMQSGVLYGYVGQVEGMVSKIKTEMGSNPCVIATGGLASLIAENTDCLEVVDPFLTLRGLQLIYARHYDGEKVDHG